MNNKKLLGYVMVGIGFAGLGAMVACQKQVEPAPAPAPPVMPAPVAVAVPADPATALLTQSLNDAGGKPQQLAQFKGKPVLVNFWAPWCGPCVKEMPELSSLSTELKAKNINVIGIGIDTPTNILEFTSKYKIAYPIYVGGMGATDLARAFGNANGSLPYTVLIGADGKVVKTYLGILKFDELRKDLVAL
ncbi:TlpA family protein disulfide reductase [Massilia sp. S19_KUP03_FR1]|uniref:TlpA family protein disulfide reductase n=1 Tax=Massilia sp. S19_KUP03_FR1 TaxID=3025503 RepID=UPI002FCD70C6